MKKIVTFSFLSIEYYDIKLTIYFDKFLSYNIQTIKQYIFASNVFGMHYRRKEKNVKASIDETI